MNIVSFFLMSCIGGKLKFGDYRKGFFFGFTLKDLDTETEFKHKQFIT